MQDFLVLHNKYIKFLEFLAGLQNVGTQNLRVFIYVDTYNWSGTQNGGYSKHVQELKTVAI